MKHNFLPMKKSEFGTQGILGGIGALCTTPVTGTKGLKFKGKKRLARVIGRADTSARNGRILATGARED